MSLPAYRINFYDGAQRQRDAEVGIAARIAQLQAAGIPPVAVALRVDILSGWPAFNGYPVERLPMSSPFMWGVIS